MKLYAVTCFENVTLAAECLMTNTIEKGWQISTLRFSDKIDDLGKVAPFVPLGEK